MCTRPRHPVQFVLPDSVTFAAQMGYERRKPGFMVICVAADRSLSPGIAVPPRGQACRGSVWPDAAPRTHRTRREPAATVRPDQANLLAGTCWECARLP